MPPTLKSIDPDNHPRGQDATIAIDIPEKIERQSSTAVVHIHARQFHRTLQLDNLCLCISPNLRKIVQLVITLSLSLYNKHCLEDRASIQPSIPIDNTIVGVAYSIEVTILPSV